MPDMVWSFAYTTAAIEKIMLTMLYQSQFCRVRYRHKLIVLPMPYRSSAVGYGIVTNISRTFYVDDTVPHREVIGYSIIKSKSNTYTALIHTMPLQLVTGQL